MAPGMGADRSRDAAPAAVLLDAMGTLVDLLPPAPRLVAALAARGAAVTEDEASAAMRAEIAFYRAHLHGAGDAAAVAGLRRRCAAVLADALPPAAAELGPDALLDALLAALRFRAFPEAPDVLRALRARETRLVVVSNWDASLHERLAETGLAGLVDGAIASAEVGSAKPDGAIFRRALALAGAPAEGSWHVGDSVEADVAGARAAGLTPVLIDRDGALEAPAGVPRIRSLADLPALAQYPPGARR
jgi:putative hydrolase of the HAD superfamily